MVKFFNSKIVMIFAVALFLASCNTNTNTVVNSDAPRATADNIDATLALKWNEVLLDVERHAPNFKPPIAARMWAHVGLAAYEAGAPGFTKYQSVASSFNGLNVPKADNSQEYYWPLAINAAYSITAQKLMPHVSSEYTFKIQALEKKYTEEYSALITPEVAKRSIEFGKAVGNAIYDWSATDAFGHEAYKNIQPSSYTPPKGEGLWQPTKPDFGAAVLPYWGKARTFVANADDKIARKPLEMSTSKTSQIYAQALEVYGMSRPSLSPENAWIAEFWGDDIGGLTFTPAGRWVAIASQVIDNTKVTLAQALETYAKVGIALSDAGMVCWNSKYLYNIQRPSDFINTNIDNTWTSRLLTLHNCVNPPFPAYPSGHATFGGAAAQVLSDIYGYNYAMTDNCHKGRTEFLGMPRSFNNFYEMAQENAYSRIPLGVHFRMDAEEGVRMGFNVGKKAGALAMKK